METVRVQDRDVLTQWWQASNFSLQNHYVNKHASHENKGNDRQS